MAIPPQLACKLSDNATAVQEFCNLAPGIPMTNQMIDDMLESLQTPIWKVHSDFSPPVDGIVRIDVYFILQEEKIGKSFKKFIRASVACFGGTSSPGTSQGERDFEKRFEFDRQGLKQAICFAQETAQNIKRRGICETCLKRERPAKRLRVGDTGLCTQCLLHKAVF